MPRAAPERLTDAFQKAIPARLLGGVGPDTIRCAALAPDGQYPAFADNGKLLHLKPLTAFAGPQPSELGLSRSIHGLVFSPDGKLLAASLTDGTVLQLEVPSLRELKRWQPRTGPSRVLAFLPDGRLAPSGRRLLTLCSPGNAGILSCWSTTTALPVMAPQTVPDGMVGRMLIPHPAGTLAGVVTDSGTIFLYDLPPMVSAAPAWLADAAEAWTGWHFGPTGLPAPTGNLEPVIPMESSATLTATWGQWLAAAPKDRTASPHGSQKISDYLTALTTVNTGKVWEEINHLQPVPGGIPAIRAVELALQRSPASAALATKLAWQALRLGGHDDVLLPAPADPAQHYREACARVNAHLKSGAAWWTAAEAAAAVARLTGAEKDKSSAWIGFMASGTSLEWVRFRIGDDTWTPSPAGSLSAILHSPINLQGMAALAQSYLRQIQR